MALQIRPPSDFDVVLVGDATIKEQVAELIEGGGVSFVELGSPEHKALIEGHPELDGPMAVVTEKGKETGYSCAISLTGRSVIVHCEDMVLPLREAPEPAPA